MINKKLFAFPPVVFHTTTSLSRNQQPFGRVAVMWSRTLPGVLSKASLPLAIAAAQRYRKQEVACKTQKSDGYQKLEAFGSAAQGANAMLEIGEKCKPV